MVFLEWNSIQTNLFRGYGSPPSEIRSAEARLATTGVEGARGGVRFWIGSGLVLGWLGRRPGEMFELWLFAPYFF